MFKRLDLRLIGILALLMLISLLVIGSTTSDMIETELDQFFTPYVNKQIQFFFLGWAVFFLFSGIDYNRLQEWTWIAYGIMVVLLLGLFFVPSIQGVQRWYRVGSIAFQPSELTKLIVVLALSWFLERKKEEASTWKSAAIALAITFVPFFLILKQPDLGTALVLFPIAIVLFYFGKIKRIVVISMVILGVLGFIFMSLLFLNVIDHETLRPYATAVIKEYQYERLNPKTYHQQAAQTAIAIGGWKGAGWKQNQFTRGRYLPAPHTDSVFSAFIEEFGLLGGLVMLALFFGLIYLSLQVALVAKDRFGQLLSVGIAIYLVMHILVNMGMMCGFLPITGVPLVLVSYGGSSVVATMSALGVLQSVYSRRFTF